MTMGRITGIKKAPLETRAQKHGKYQNKL